MYMYMYIYMYCLALLSTLTYIVHCTATLLVQHMLPALTRAGPREGCTGETQPTLPTAQWKETHSNIIHVQYIYMYACTVHLHVYIHVHVHVHVANE